MRAATRTAEAKQPWKLTTDGAPPRSWATTPEIEAAQVGSVETALLLHHLHGTDTLLRIEIVEELGRRRYQPAAKHLVLILCDEKNGLLRLCAAEALGDLRVRDAHVAKALGDALTHDPKPLVRAYAAESVGKLRFTELRSAMCERLVRERNTRVRASLLAGLYRLGDDEALRALLKLLRRVRRWEVRTAILNILKGLAAPSNTMMIDAAVRGLIEDNETLAPELRWFFVALNEPQRGTGEADKEGNQSAKQ